MYCLDLINKNIIEIWVKGHQASLIIGQFDIFMLTYHKRHVLLLTRKILCISAHHFIPITEVDDWHAISQLKDCSGAEVCIVIPKLSYIYRIEM